MQHPNTIDKIQELLKIFSHPTRLKIIDLLLDGECYVDQICKRLNMQQSTISHQLRLLRKRNVVKTKRDGKKIYYTLKDKHVETIYKMARDHVLEC